MNATITEADYRRQLDRVGGRAFLFFGNEDYLKTHALLSTRQRLCPDESFAFFNDVTIDVMEYSAERLLDAMMPPPMMTDYRLVVVRSLVLGDLKAAELDELVDVLSQLRSYPHNTVIIYTDAGQFDAGRSPKKPSNLLKKLADVLVPVRFEPPTPQRLVAWVTKHFAHDGVLCEPAECALLVSICGNNMYVLANEVTKLVAYVKQHGRASVTADDVRAVASPTSACDAFALTNAILAGRASDALQALSVMKFQRVEPVAVMGEISATVYQMKLVRTLMDAGMGAGEIARTTGLNEFKIERTMGAVARIAPERMTRTVSLCVAADAALKRGGDYAVIERLICSL